MLSDYPRDENGETVKPAVGYVQITLDLSAYLSDNMKIRFHCYDADNDGLSYWWQIDDVEISSSETSGISTIETETPSKDNGNHAIYTIDGKNVTGKDLPKGIYIQNGKKIVIK